MLNIVHCPEPSRGGQFIVVVVNNNNNNNNNCVCECSCMHLPYICVCYLLNIYVLLIKSHLLIASSYLMQLVLKDGRMPVLCTERLWLQSILFH